MDRDERRLLQSYRRLHKTEQGNLLAFAEFLVERCGIPQDTEIRSLARPESETVVGAIKRLSASYHMLDRSKMLHETAGLMSEHLLHGRPAVEVIDDLELIFSRHYQQQYGESG